MLLHDEPLCRKCFSILVHPATIAMGICGDCLVEAEKSPKLRMKRPNYGGKKVNAEVGGGIPETW